MEFWWNFGFQISQIFWKVNYSFVGFFDKISDPYNKTRQKFKEYFDSYRQVK